MAGGGFELDEEDVKIILASAADLPLFKKDIEFFEKHSEEFLKQYPDKWVAILNERVVGAHEDYQILLENLKQKGIRSERLVVHFIDPNPRPMILTAAGQI